MEIENPINLTEEDFFKDFSVSPNYFYNKNNLININPYTAIRKQDFKPYNLQIILSNNEQNLQKIMKINHILNQNQILNTYMWPLSINNLQKLEIDQNNNNIDNYRILVIQTNCDALHSLSNEFYTQQFFTQNEFNDREVLLLLQNMIEILYQNLIPNSLYHLITNNLQLLKKQIKPMHDQQKIINFENFYFQTEQYQFYEKQGICTLQNLQKQEPQTKWIDRQDNIIYILQALLEQLDILHKNNLYYSNSSINAEHRKYVDRYCAARTVQLLMLSSIDVPEPIYFKNKYEQIQNSLKLLENYYNQDLVDQLKILLSPYDSKNLPEQQTKLQNLKQKLNPKQNYIYDDLGLLDEFLLTVDKSLNDQLIQDDIQILNICDAFRLLKTGVDKCLYYYNQNEKYFQTLEQYDNLYYIQLTYIMGRIFLQDKQYTRALQFFLMHYKQANMMDIKMTAEVETQIGLCYSIENKQKFCKQDDLILSQTYVRLADLYIMYNQYQQAHKYYELALKGLEKLQNFDSDVEYLYVLENLSIVTFHLKQFDRSLYYINQLIDCRQKNDMIDQKLAEQLQYKATLFQGNLKEDPEQAIQLYEQAIAIQSLYVQENDFKFAVSYYNLAYEQSRLSAQKKDLELYKVAKQNVIKAIDILEINGEKNSFQNGQANSLLADILMELGEDLDAEPYLQQAYYIYGKIYGNNHFQTQDVYSKLIEIIQMKQQIKENPKLIEEAKKLKSEFGNEVKDYLNVLIQNPTYNAETIIDQINKGLLKIKLDNGKFLQKDNPQQKDNALKMVKVFGGQPEDYYKLLADNQKYTTEEIISKIRNGQLELKIGGQKLVPLDIIEEEKKQKIKKQALINSEFFPLPNFQEIYTLTNPQKTQQKILDFNQKISENKSYNQLALNLNSEMKYFDNIIQFIDRENPNYQLQLEENSIDLLKNKLINWPNEFQVPIFDILRHLALKPQIKRLLIGSSLVQIISTCCDLLQNEQAQVPVIGLYLTFFVNLMKTSSYTVMDNQKQILSAIFSVLEKREKELLSNKNFSNQIANFFYNYCKGVLENSQKIYKKQFIQKVVQIVLKYLQLTNDQSDTANQEDIQLKYLISLAHIVLAQIEINQPVIEIQLIDNLNFNNASAKVQKCLKDVKEQILSYQKVLSQSQK
ncbi:hypothetical protein PPERSA_12236 [Pseudocohnilembus persalinus]|uniref:PUL domain-containing protein n=1 Tax=Pseudocohnilembus persalinus TaxID=266149 RepID=A0A0V0R5I1_PSEPJ|nr:hypothetical protein PPERSA_12236 [Pseudocohnilembus persalinus]|eukprot:KRX09493.1 hypothetical protein PPERSA_12236 [Pseudocohnilembus persalinus]